MTAIVKKKMISWLAFKMLILIFTSDCVMEGRVRHTAKYGKRFWG